MSIIEFPQIASIKDEIKKLKTELSMLLLEHDELVYIISKNIETSYMLKLGYLEIEAYKLNCEILRLKRKIQLIQAKINHQKKIVLNDIENILSNEFQEYQNELDKQINKMNDALNRKNSPFLSDEETLELKKLYRSIAKVLHPDLNPDLSSEKLQLFYNAVQAYKNGDLDSLRIIDSILDKNTTVEHQNQLSVLKNEKLRLEDSISNICNSIKNVKDNYPYKLKEILEDENLFISKQLELQNIITSSKDLILHYTGVINKLLG